MHLPQTLHNSCFKFVLTFSNDWLLTSVLILTHPVFLTGIFSESTVRGLEFYGKSNPAFYETARFLKFVGNIWKIMSVKSPSKGVCVVTTGKVFMCVERLIS